MLSHATISKGYMEDFMDLKESLSCEARVALETIRELDVATEEYLSCQKFTDNTSFEKFPHRATLTHSVFQSILKELFKQPLEYSEKKIEVAEEIHRVSLRYLEAADKILAEFKSAMESNYPGSTEPIEKKLHDEEETAARSDTEMQPSKSTTTTKENRLPKKQSRIKVSSVTSGNNSSSSGRSKSERKGSSTSTTGSIPSTVTLEAAIASSASTASTAHTASGRSIKAQSGSITYPLQRMGAGGNAIAKAASQAIAATQQFVPGRRTSSLKASYEAINLGVQTHEFSIGRELAGAAQSAVAATALESSSSYEPKTKYSKLGTKDTRRSPSPDYSEPSSSTEVLLNDGSASIMTNSTLLGDSSPADLLGRESDTNDFPESAEPRYCICNQISYGEMVACDNVDCPYEWFHYSCVGISAPPKGKWYCSFCTDEYSKN